LTALSQFLPHRQPMQSRVRWRESTGFLKNPPTTESLLEQCSSSNLVQSSEPENKNSVDDLYADLKKLHQMIKSNRFDEVQGLLVRASAMQDCAWTDKAIHEIIDQRDIFGNTPLITAVQQGHKRLCKLLISLRANTNSQNKEGNTPLHYAAKYGYHGLFDYLSKRGADDTVTNYAGKLCYQMSESKGKILFGKSLKYEGRKEEAQSKFPVLINRARP
jgi:ankyrin repeat protein